MRLGYLSGELEGISLGPETRGGYLDIRNNPQAKEKGNGALRDTRLARGLWETADTEPDQPPTEPERRGGYVRASPRSLLCRRCAPPGSHWPDGHQYLYLHGPLAHAVAPHRGKPDGSEHSKEVIMGKLHQFKDELLKPTPITKRQAREGQPPTGGADLRTRPRGLLAAGVIGIVIGGFAMGGAIEGDSRGLWIAAWIIVTAGSAAFFVGAVAYGVSLGIRHADERRGTHRGSSPR